MVAIDSHDELEQVVGSDRKEVHARHKMRQRKGRSRGFDHDPQRDSWIEGEATFSQVVLGFLEALAHDLDLLVGRDHRDHHAQTPVDRGTQKGLKLLDKKCAMIKQYPHSPPSKLWIVFRGDRETTQRFVCADINAAEGHFFGGDLFDDLAVQGELSIFAGPRSLTEKEKLCAKQADALGGSLFVFGKLGQ